MATSLLKVWTRLLGSSGSDYAKALTTGLDGSIYVSGSTTGALDGQTNSGSSDAFLTKYSVDGTKVWTRLLGSSASDSSYGVTTGLDGSIYVMGETLGSIDGQTNNGDWDAFLTKYSADGTKAWTKLLGSSSADYGNGIGTGLDGSIYIIGHTAGSLEGQVNSGGFDAFLTKYNTNGIKVWTKLLGSSGDDQPYGVTTGPDGSIYVCGYTSGSLDGQTNSGGIDAFLTKYSADGTKAWTRLLGQSGTDFCVDLVAGLDGSIYIVGHTSGSLDGQSNSGGFDAFLTKYSADGAKAWTRLLGSSATDTGRDVTVGVDGSIYVVGYTGGSFDGQTNNGNADAYLSKYSVDGTKAWTLLLGSSANDYAWGVTTGPDSSIYVTGDTFGALDGQTNNGDSDAFLIRYQDLTATPTYALSSGSTSVNEGATATFTLTTTNVTSGTSVAYTLSGISAADIKGELLTGSATVNSSGVATISVGIAADGLTEGAETLSVTAGGKTASVTINDTSTAAVVDDYPWDTATTGVLSVSGAAISGNIEVNDDYDLFKANLTAGTTYVFDAVSSGTIGLIHPFLLLYSPVPLTLLLTDTDGGGSLNARITYTAANTGTYYVGVTNYSAVGTGAYQVSLKTATPTYALSSSSTSVNEGYTVTFTLTTTNVASGTSVPYTVSGVSAADITGGILSGTATVNSSGTASIYILLAADLLTEGAETLTVTAGGASASTTVNDTSKTPSATYSLITNYSATTEGTPVIATMSTSNVAAGTTLYYQITGTGINTTDLSGLSLAGTGVVNSSGQVSMTIPLASDLATEGDETFYLQYYTDSGRSVAAGSAAAVTIYDTSKGTATYSLSAGSSSVNEGSIATFTLTTTNLALGTSVAYTLSGISTADIAGGLLTGSATVNSSGTTTISVGIVADSLTEGAETLTVTAQSKSATVTIKDTSLTTTGLSKIWSKLIGGNATEIAYSIAIGLDDSIYVSGSTYSSFDGQVNSGGADAFLAKFSNTGVWAWTRLLGSASQDAAYAVGVGNDGFVYVTANGNLEGYTSSGGDDVYLTKLNIKGDTIWTKSLASTATDKSTGLVVGANGSIYITGSTDGFLDGQANGGGSDIFLTMYSADGTKAWTQLFGTTGKDQATGICTSSDGFVYVCGYTSANLDGQSNSGGSFDAVLVKFRSDGTKVWTRLFGSSGQDVATSLTVGLDGSIYVCGNTDGSIAGQASGGGFDAFITKYSSDGVMAWTRLIGTASEEYGYGIATGLDGSIYVCGLTTGTLDGQSNSIGRIGFISKFSTNGDKESTQLFNQFGAVNGADPYYLKTGLDGSIYAVGWVRDVMDGQATGGSSDAFLVKLQGSNLPTYSLSASSTTVDEGSIATFTLSTTFVAAGTSLAYTLSGVSAADITGGLLTGTATINSSGTATILVPIAADVSTEGTEALSVTVQSKTATITINDSSKTPATYALSTASASVDEGAIATFSLVSTNVAGGTSISYTITGVSTADVTGGLTGTTTVDTSGVATIYVPVAADFVTEGAETLSVTAQGKSASITVNDTSKAAVVAAYAMSAASSSVDEGASAVFTLTTTNVAGGTSIPYTVSGISAADVTGGALSGVAIVNSSGVATIYVPVAADFSTEGAETLTVTAQGKSASMTVNDISKTVVTVPVVTGTPAADTIINSTGSENIDGGAGVDTLKYTSSSTVVVVSQVAGKTVVTNTATGDVDTLSNVERLTFANQSVALDMGTTQPGGQAVLLLGAVLGRTATLAKTDLLGTLVGLFDQGFNFQTIAGALMRLDIWGVLTGNASATNTQIANYLLTTVNGVAPSAATLASAVAALNSETSATQGSFLAGLALSTANQSSVKLSDLAVRGLPYTVPPTYSLVASASSVNEGAVASFTLSTTNVGAGTTISYTISGISFFDLVMASLSGTVVVNSAGIATIYLQTHEDRLTEGTETLKLTVEGASASILVNDTSVTPAVATYSLAPNTSSMNEGGIAGFTLRTTNVAAGTSVAYVLSGLSAADITGGSLSGTVLTDSSGMATIAVAVAADALTEGAETLVVTAQGASASMLINDTSTTPVATYSLAPNTSSVNEGGIAGFTLRTTNVAAGTSVGYSISGLTAADISGGSLFGSVQTDSNGLATIGVSILEDLFTEGTEIIYVSVQNTFVTPTIIVVGSMLVYDTSLTPISTIDNGR